MNLPKTGRFTLLQKNSQMVIVEGEITYVKVDQIIPPEETHKAQSNQC